MPQVIAQLPAVLKEGHAYGTLEVRDSENSRALRSATVASVRLSDGVLFLEEPLSRDAYDWCSDYIEFRPYRTRTTIPVEEGSEFEGALVPGEAEIEFCLHKADLAQLGEVWAARAPQPSPTKAARPRPR